MKVIALHPIQHDNVHYAADSVIDMNDDHSQAVIDAGVARIAKDTYPVDEGTPVVRKPIKEKDKIKPTKKQIEEAEAAANEPEITVEGQFAKTTVANSAVAGGDVKKIKEAKPHRRS